MAEFKTSIIIEAEADSAAKVVDALRKKFDGLTTSAKQTDASPALNRTRTAAESVSRAVDQLRRLFIGLAAAAGVARTIQSLTATADAYATIVARLRLVTSSQGEFNAVFGELRAIADRNLAPLQETAQAYARIAPAVKNLGGTFRETLGITEAVTLALRVSGATAQEQASAMLQFAQGLSSNFQGDEFRALTEAAPRLLQAVADGMGRNITELKALSSQGKLTADVVSNALLKSLAQLREEAQGLPRTVAGSFNVLQNAALQYVGSTDQATGASRTLADAVLVVARNFKTLADVVVLLVGALAALGIGRIAAALAGLATAGGGVAAVFARIVALVGGPIGLTVSLIAAAAAFVGLRRAGQETTDDLEPRVKRLREEIERLRGAREALARGEPSNQAGDPGLAALERRRAELQRLQNTPVVSRTGETFRDTSREIAEIDRQIAARSRLLDEERKLTEQRDKERGQLGTLQASAKSIEEVTKGLQTRSGILREYEQRVRDITLAFSAAAKRAREAGDADRVAELARQQSEALAAAAKERDDAMQALAGVSSLRIPQLRQAFDQVYTLHKDRLEREKDSLDLSLRDQLISIKGYYAERRRIADEELQADLRRLESERSAQQRHLAELQARRAQAAPDRREQFDDQIFNAQQRILEVNTEIQIAQSRRLQEGRRLASDQAAAERDLANALAQVRDRLAEIEGGGGEATRQRLQREFEPLLRQLRAAGDNAGQQQVAQLIDVEANLADLAKLEREFTNALSRMRAQEQSIEARRSVGLLSESQARAQILQLHQQTAAEVEGLIPRMEALANAIPGEEKRTQVAGIKVEFERLKLVVDDVALAVNGSVRDAFATLFRDIASGAKSAKDIVLDFLDSIQKRITDIAAQNLADKLFGGAGTGGLGGIISKLFNGGGAGGGASPWALFDFFDAVHRGGIAGRSTGLMRRVNPLVFAGAPRLHRGGLAPNEVPAILEAGEEVLTRDDPRHRWNGGGGVSINGPLMVVQTPDANSFRHSQRQIASDLASLIDRGLGYT